MTTTVHNYSEPTVLRADSFPMRLYEKAKRLGVWNPTEIDFSQDRTDWEAMEDERRKAILRLTTRFLAGEEAVTLDLLPLILAIARQGRLEEEMFLTTFLFEEAKHTDFFSRWVREVAGSPKLPRAPEPSVQLFDVELPSAMNALLEDSSPVAIARASVTYNMVIEGVLAETGYHNYHQSLALNGLMPGLCAGLVNIKRDESRHIAYGVYLLSRLVAEDPSVWEAIEQRMGELRPLVDAIIRSGYEAYPDGITPFGLRGERASEFAANQFRKRYERISKARHRTLAEIDAESEPAEVEDLVAEV
jgi:ribonucleoside-diphosphate reductase beta chain